MCYKLYINVINLHIEVKVRENTIENQSLISCESCNANQRIFVKQFWLCFSLGCEVDI